MQTITQKLQNVAAEITAAGGTARFGFKFSTPVVFVNLPDVKKYRNQYPGANIQSNWF